MTGLQCNVTLYCPKRILLAEMVLNEINTVKPFSFLSLSCVRVYLALENSRHFTTPQLVSRKMTSQGPKGGVPGALEPWSPEISAVEPGALPFY